MEGMEMRVLVVEKRDNVRAMLRVLLWRQGASVDEASDNQSALHKIHQDAPDAMITCVDSPNTSGPALIRCLRQLRKGGKIPVLLYTNDRRTSGTIREFVDYPNVSVVSRPSSNSVRTLTTACV